MTKYEVEFDNGALVEIETDPPIEEIFTEEYIEDWNRYFYNINTPEGHLRQLAYLALTDHSSFWEGYGDVKHTSHYRKEFEIINGDSKILGTGNAFVLYSGNNYHTANVRQV